MTLRSSLTLLLLVAACAPRADRVVVGSKNFTEQDILGEIMAQQIERRTSLHVERKLHLGGTFVCHKALVTGQIDVYPEYTGTALVAILDQAPTADADSASPICSEGAIAPESVFAGNMTAAASKKRSSASV